MEKLVTNRLNCHVAKNGLLANVQGGFGGGRGTVDQVMRLRDTIGKCSDNRGYGVAVFIDFQSACGMLWHHGIFCELLEIGMDGRVFTYVQQFLTRRAMRVRVGSGLSETRCLEGGTPQGSIISPLLFLIMIGDLPSGIKDTETTLFADDSCMFKSGKNLDVIVRKMQSSLNKLTE